MFICILEDEEILLGGDDIETTEKDTEINLQPNETLDAKTEAILNELNQNKENSQRKEVGTTTTTSIPYQVLNTESTTTSKPQTTSTRNLNIRRKFNRYNKIIKNILKVLIISNCFYILFLH